MKNSIYRLPPITLLAILIEFTIIIVVSVNATSQFLTPDPLMKLPGYEGEWLTSSTQFASQTLNEYGYIPLWQPYISRGEPLIDSPFSMVLNPISTLPALIFGGNVGLRYSVVLIALLAGFGGWTLGRMLSLGSLGRILLALLMVGKGNMLGLIGQGYFQLGGSQAYIPWIIAGTIGILRMKHRRFPIALTAIMFTLMFWAGNIYFLLPTLISMLGLALTHLFSIERDTERFQIWIDQVALKRLILAGVFTVGLSAITFIPIFAHQGQIGGHPNEVGSGTYANLGAVLRMFFDSSRLNYDMGRVPGGPEFYHSYILPPWFALLIFILLPPIKRLYQSALSRGWQVWSVGIVIIIFFTLWGAGQNPIVAWLYENVPLIGQWRFVGRMLGIVTFWIAVLVAMRVDGLWQAVVIQSSWKSIPLLIRIPGVRLAFSLLIIGISLSAASQVVSQWKEYAGPFPVGVYSEDECVEWVRAQYPDRYLSIWTLNYENITVYLENDARHANIAADFFVIPNPPTLYKGDLTRLLPEFLMPWSDDDRSFGREQGFTPIRNSPAPNDIDPCLWQKDDAFSYTFQVPVSALEAVDTSDDRNTLAVEVTTPITSYVQYPDQIGLRVTASPDEPLAVVVQEVAYPGWMVEVDGAPASLESIGGLLGVVLPTGNEAHFIHFSYRPPLFFIGSIITLVTWVFCILYLVYADRLIPSQWKIRSASLMQRTGSKVYTTLTSKELFEPRLYMEPEFPLLPPGEVPQGREETVQPNDNETSDTVQT